MDLINNISLNLLVISPTIFVLGVTLLGSAVEKSKQEEKAARESESSIIKKEIEEVEKSLIKAKKDGDTTEVYYKLSVLKKREKDTNSKIQEIKNKYKAIDLLNTVIYPCVAFLLVLILNQYDVFLYKTNLMTPLYIVFLSQILLLVYGLFKIYYSLRLIEEISISKKESEYYDRAIECIKSALTQYDQDKKEELSIEFIEKSFPLNVTCSTELEIKFKIGFKKGTVLNDVSVWFYIPDGFDLIKPPESDSWRQSSKSTVPNIRTVKIFLGKISIGTLTPGSLKIKTPEVAGKYSLIYSIKGDGYNGSNNELKLFVG